jgi:hypothetical protein
MIEKQIECQVVKDLVSAGTERSASRIRVVRWIVDGKDTGALLEKRSFFKTKEGEEKMGKAKGFNLTDLKYLVENWKDIEPLM